MWVLKFTFLISTERLFLPQWLLPFLPSPYSPANPQQTSFCPGCSGKTAWLFNVIYQNMDKSGISPRQQLKYSSSYKQKHSRKSHGLQKSHWPFTCPVNTHPCTNLLGLHPRESSSPGFADRGRYFNHVHCSDTFMRTAQWLPHICKGFLFKIRTLSLFWETTVQ